MKTIAMIILMVLSTNLKAKAKISICVEILSSKPNCISPLNSRNYCKIFGGSKKAADSARNEAIRCSRVTFVDADIDLFDSNSYSS